MNQVPVRSIGRIASWSREDSALDPTVRRRLFASNRAMIVVCSHSSPEYPSAHMHAFDQITTVVRGRVEVWLDGETCSLEAGRSLLVRAGTPHACRAADGAGADVFHVYPPGSDTSPDGP